MKRETPVSSQIGSEVGQDKWLDELLTTQVYIKIYKVLLTIVVGGGGGGGGISMEHSSLQMPQSVVEYTSNDKGNKEGGSELFNVQRALYRV